MRSKYRSRKVTIDGITFDSTLEGNRYRQLKVMENEGVISDLRLQVRYPLVPAQRFNGERKDRGVDYIADFVYVSNGEKIVEDVKGVKTKEFIIKRKLMKWIHGIEVQLWPRKI